jgi:hypothetical protein
VRGNAPALKRARPALVPSFLRALGALLGTLPLALLASLLLARYLPVQAETRFVLGFALCLPLWLTAMTVAWVSERSALVWVLSVLAIAGLVCVGSP